VSSDRSVLTAFRPSCSSLAPSVAIMRKQPFKPFPSADVYLYSRSHSHVSDCWRALALVTVCSEDGGEEARWISGPRCFAATRRSKTFSRISRRVSLKSPVSAHGSTTTSSPWWRRSQRRTRSRFSMRSGALTSCCAGGAVVKPSRGVGVLEYKHEDGSSAREWSLALLGVRLGLAAPAGGPDESRRLRISLSKSPRRLPDTHAYAAVAEERRPNRIHHLAQRKGRRTSRTGFLSDPLKGELLFLLLLRRSVAC
jgi:hypothetical protein